MSTSALITRIADAFPVEPVPQLQDILYNEEKTYRGSFPVESELAEIKSFFGNRRWDLVTPEDVFQFRHALSFFSKSALAYYTAAWMTCALRDEDAVDTAIDNLVSKLGKASTDLWTQEQRQAICEWLIHFNVSELSSSKQDFANAEYNLRCGQARA